VEKIIYANGTAELLVPAGQKIAIATYGNEYATLSFKRGNNLEFIQRLDNAQVTLGPWSDVRAVNIEAAQDPVSYDVGTAPNIESNVRMSSNPITGGKALSSGGQTLSLRAAIQAAAQRRLPAPISGGPTITVTSAATNTIAVPYSDPRISLMAATWVLQAGQARARPVTSDPSGTGIAYTDPTTAFAGSSSGAIEFWSDGPKVEVRLVCEFAKVFIDTGTGFQDAGATALVDGSTRYLTMDWTGVRAPRLYRIEITATNPAYFHSVYVGATDSIWASTPYPVNAICMGDSFTEPTFGDATPVDKRFDGMAQRLGRLLGIQDFRICGSGGTGFVQTNVPTGRGNFQTRLSADVLTKGPFDLVILFGSGNDGGNTATLPAATANLLTQIRAGNPNAKIIVVGSWRKGSDAGLDAYYDAVDVAIRAGIDLSGVPCGFISQAGWITGTGKTGALTGVGNADLFTGADGTHPTQAGHIYRSFRLAEEIRKLIFNW
jgi:lysophospholipase L1-like esterase